MSPGVVERVEAVVVGGGIAGLAAARELSMAGLPVLLLEGSSRLGGKIAGVRLGHTDLRVDVGAESILVRRPEALQLVASLGLGEQLVHPTPATSRILVEGRAVDVPTSAMGVPGDVDALSTLLTPTGLERARREPTLPAPPLPGDIAIGALVDERFGPEVTDRLLEPLLGGVYAGHARRLSFAAVNPTLYAAARAGDPLSQHAAATRRPGSGPVFGGLVGGIAVLVDALVADLRARGVEVRRAATVRELTAVGGGYRLTVGPTRNAYRIDTRAVVLATPAAPTGRLLSGVATSAGRLAAIPYASMAVVALGVRGIEPIGSGLLVPPGQLPTVKAVTHSSNKWAWVAEAAERELGAGVHLVRASVGRLGEERLLQVGDAELVDRTVAELRGLPGWAGAQVMSSTLQRWGGGLPQYEVGHRDLVTRLRSELAGCVGLAVCGAAYDGVGIAACLGSAATAVNKITADLGVDR
ncbi:MAG TPA: protoporphyrinogen oxidase [Microlunatus sp.]|nr:protoporphyrinogen oxidase [Microlunatus sp.]